MKTSFWMLLTALLFSSCSFLADKPVTEAQFPGGEETLAQYVVNHLRYPADAEGMVGTVIVKFYVEKDGSISQPEIVDSVSASLDREALKLIENMPNWEPGRRGKNPVRTEMKLPVRFVLKQN